jgi:hypothetical protein
VEIATIRYAECSHSEMLRQLAALVQRTGHPQAIGELTAFCVTPETLWNWPEGQLVSTEKLVKIAADLADSFEVFDQQCATELREEAQIVDREAEGRIN